MRPAVRADGLEVYEYALVYLYDLIMIGVHPEVTACQISQFYKFKNNLAEKPTQYLGADIGELPIETMLGTNTYWYMSSEEYCKNAIVNMETWLEKRRELLPTKTSCCLPSKWKPELDVTPELNAEDTSFYQQQIGVLRWMVELGRIDICTEVSM